MNRRISLSLLLVGLSAQIVPAAEANDVESHFGKVYAERESGPLKADLYIPGGEGPFPGVLVVHGGAWHMGSRAQLSGIARMLAQSGFTAVAINYRLAPDHKFPAQIEDCQQAVRWMRTNADRLKLDPDRIAGFGYSAGAQLVSLLGTLGASGTNEGGDGADLVSDYRLQAVVGGGAPCDFREFPIDAKWLAYWLGGTRRELSEQYTNASPAAFVTSYSPPMFFFHGEDDMLVPLESPQAMCRQLQMAGVPAELYVIPQVGHTFAMVDRDAITKSIEFLTNHLKQGGEINGRIANDE